MRDLPSLHSFIQIIFAVDTLFTLYNKVTTWVLNVRNFFLKQIHEEVLALALTIDDIDKKTFDRHCGAVTAKVTRISDFYMILQKWASIFFRAVSFLASIICIYLLYLEQAPKWFPISDIFILITPFPLFCLVSIIILVFNYCHCRIIFWALKFTFGSKIPSDNKPEV